MPGSEPLALRLLESPLAGGQIARSVSSLECTPPDTALALQYKRLHALGTELGRRGLLWSICHGEEGADLESIMKRLQRRVQDILCGLGEV